MTALDTLTAESIATRITNESRYWRTICALNTSGELDLVTAAQACTDVILACIDLTDLLQVMRREAMTGARLAAAAQESAGFPLTVARAASQAVVDNYLRDNGIEAVSLRNHAANECSE